jgi:Domain of unknown function (DUF4258)
MLKWTMHAEQMRLERSIQHEWVVHAVNVPERLEADPVHPNRHRAYKRISANGGRWLRVIYEEIERERTVITVFFDRNAGRWL